MHQSIPPAPMQYPPPQTTGGHLPALSVLGVGHLQILHCPGADTKKFNPGVEST